MWRVILIIGVWSSVGARPLSLQVASEAAILINADTGAVLYEKNIHDQHGPGSTTKVAVALYVLEKKGGNLGEVVEASREALYSVHASVRQAEGSKHPSYRLEHDGTSAQLRVGEKMTLEALLHGLLLASGNDAANVLGEWVSGSVGRFMEELNLFLRQLGLQKTTFTNPHGLYDAQHVTTAHDLALLTRVALKHPVLKKIVRTVRYEVTPLPGQPAHVFVQSNRLLRQGPFFYPKAIGVKIGYTGRTRHTFVGAAEHEGRTLIVALLKTPEGRARYHDATALFEAAFAEKKVARRLFAKESDYFTHHVRGKEMRAELKEDVVLEYFPAEEPQFRAEIVWGSVKLPVAAGDRVGVLRCVDARGNTLIEKPLCAVAPVAEKRVYWKVVTACMLGAFFLLLLLQFVKKGQEVVKR